jgi:anti-sigma B factor antagonist
MRAATVAGRLGRPALDLLLPTRSDGVGMENPIESVLADDCTAVLTVRGEIDFSNADELASTIRDAVSVWSPPTMLVDLGDATFIDSTGLGPLVEGYRAALSGECRFVVVNPTASFRRVLVITGLSDLFGLAKEPDDADAHETSPNVAI